MTPPKELPVTVTQDDIDHGEESDCRNCPVARASSRAFGAPMKSGGATLAIADAPHYRPIYGLPTSVTTWISRFDRGEPVEPFAFVATLVSDEPVEETL